MYIEKKELSPIFQLLELATNFLLKIRRNNKKKLPFSLGGRCKQNAYGIVIEDSSRKICLGGWGDTHLKIHFGGWGGGGAGTDQIITGDGGGGGVLWVTLIPTMATEIHRPPHSAVVHILKPQ